MNGSHNFKSATEAPVAYSSGVDDEQPSETRHSRRKRNHSLTNSFHYAGNLSSHSSSRLSNSSSSDDDDASSNDDSSVPFFRNSLTKRQKSTFDESNAQQRIERTPVASRSRDYKDCEFTPDSGIAVTPCPGSSGISSTNNLNKHFSDGNNNSNRSGSGSGGGGSGSRTNNNHKINGDESLTTSMKLFQQSMARIRRNFRNIGDVSFSEDSDWTSSTHELECDELNCRICIHTQMGTDRRHATHFAIDNRQNWYLFASKVRHTQDNSSIYCLDNGLFFAPTRAILILWKANTQCICTFSKPQTIYIISKCQPKPMRDLLQRLRWFETCRRRQKWMRCDVSFSSIVVFTTMSQNPLISTENIIILKLINQ